jgi:outer membrane protein OmpA-like peptidoglycan-associated protein
MRQIILLIGLFSFVSAFSQTFEVEKIEFKFNVKKWEAINSKFSDFSAVLQDNKIVFTTDRNIDQVNIGENNWKKGKHYNIFSYELIGDSILTAELKKPLLFSEKFSSNSHTGPICFSESKDTVFFSRVEKAKLKGKTGKFHFKPQLYMCLRSKNGYGKLQKLAFNQNGYSFTHPSFDSKSKTLYFTSDLPGGKGEGDIYRSKMDSSGAFTIVENLGDQINSASNEMFPFYYNGDLFYSSNKEGGIGGLDMYWSYEKNEQWNKSLNLGESINTSNDDFGINIYADYTRGFISSNIEGNDDIFYFEMEKIVILQNELVGKFSYRNLDSEVSGIKVQITSDDLDMVFETVSDENGKFNLKELPSGQKYKIEIVNNNEDDLFVTFYDNQGNVVSNMIINGKGNFEFKKLNSEASLLATIDNEDDFDLKRDYTGKIVTSKNDIPKDKLEVHLVDKNGNTFKVTETDRFGNFQFKEIDYSSTNRFKLIDPEDDYSLFVFNSDGEVVSKLRIDENGVFNYRKLESESSDLAVIETNEDNFSFEKKWYAGELLNAKGQKIDKNEIFIEVFDQNQKSLGSSRIGESGKFIFSELPIEDIYLFKTDYEEESDLRFVLYDFKGNVVAKLVRDEENGYFIYRSLGSDSSNLDLANYNENIDFKFNSNNKNNSDNISLSGDKNVVYFDVNSSFMTETEKMKLKQLIGDLKSVSGKIIIEGHTDINGENEYNKWLSERRSQRVLNYLVGLGIQKDRLEIGHYGEEKPEKICPNGNCGDDIHKLNRRVTVVYRN